MKAIPVRVTIVRLHWYALRFTRGCAKFRAMARQLRFFEPGVLVLPLLTGLAGCQAQSPGGSSPGASGAAGGASSGAGQPVSTSPLLPARIRRLSNAEYENSAQVLVGSAEPVTAAFAPDTRQSGYTINDAQRVDSVLVKQIANAATQLAAQVRVKLATLAPCADPVTQAEACAKTFIQSFATRAYRRPLAADEAQKLLELFHVAADGASYADGIEQVASGVLQSAAFLYLTETGNAAPGRQVTLTPYETASAISYLVTAGPPDAELLSSAANGQLETPEQRSTAFSRLVSGADPASRERVLRVIQEWLGTDRLPDTAKDSVVYGNFAALKPAMLSETADFVDHLLAHKSGTVGELLGANWTATKDTGLAQLYEGSANGAAEGEISLPARRGILNQGAFLSVYAHASETGPVLRGVAIERRVVCIDVPSPSTLKITVPPLPVDSSKTMRERLATHVSDPMCASCHTNIDAFGFAFELYNGMGQAAPPPVDSHTTLSVGKDFDGDYADSNQLATALSNSAAVRECFARNVFRASAGRSDDQVSASENAFIDYWRTASVPSGDAGSSHPATAVEGSILETLRAFITSPTFTLRRAQ